MGVDRISGVTGSAPPRVPAAEVGRLRLTRELDRVPPGGIALVVAPAGSGKSVLLSQWVGSLLTPACRVQVSPAHDDPVIFGRDLTAAIELATPGFDSRVSDSVTAGGPDLGAVFMSRLLVGLEDLEGDLVLVFDDVHRLRNAAIWADMDQLADRLPTNVRLVLSARWDPPLHLQRLRLTTQLLDIRADDLAFDSEEGGALLSAVSGTSLTQAQIEALVARTDGWAAGLQLAAISLQGSVDPGAFIDGFSGTDRLVADYLAEEVIDDLEPDVQGFLLETSVLEWLSPEVCDAVTGESNAQEMLEALARRSLFLVHPDHGQRLRYHHLFSDLLRDRLRATRPDQEPRLRRRAASFLLEHDHLADAIEQLLAAGDGVEVVRLIDERGQDFFEREETSTVARWLTTARQQEPNTPVALDINLLAAQLASHDTGSAVETYRRLRRLSDLDAGEAAAAAALYACLGLNDLPSSEVHRSAGEAIALLKTSDVVADFLGIGGRDTVEFLAVSMNALAWLHDGQLAESVRGFEHALELPGAQYRLWRVFALGGLALALALAGRSREARGHAETAIAFSEANGIAHHHGLAYSHLAMARVSLDELDRDNVTYHLHESELRVLRSGRAALRSLQHLFRIEHLATSAGSGRALSELRSSPPITFEPAFFVELRRALELQLLVSSKMLGQARAFVEDDPSPPLVLGASIELEVATGDVGAARRTLDLWVHEPDPRRTIERLLGTVAVLSAEGRTALAEIALRAALDRAEPELLRQPFLTHQAVMRILLHEAERGSQTFARSILRATAATEDQRRDAQEQLIEALTDRELEILDYLPTRFSNSEIAAHLFVSVNTLKSHLRSIYAKLAIRSRDEAVSRARDLGLL